MTVTPGIILLQNATPGLYHMTLPLLGQTRYGSNIQDAVTPAYISWYWFSMVTSDDTHSYTQDTYDGYVVFPA